MLNTVIFDPWQRSLFSRQQTAGKEPLLAGKTRAFKPKKDTGECFSTKLKDTCKNSGTFEGKEILPEKVTYVTLAPSHSIMTPLTFIKKCLFPKNSLAF